MQPEVLVGLFAYSRLYPAVDDSAIFFIVAAGVVFQHWAEVYFVARVVRLSVVAEKHHRRAIELRKATTGGDRSGEITKERYENRVLGAIVLIGSIPEQPAFF